MEVTQQSKLRFIGVNIINLHYTLGTPSSEENIELLVDAKVFYPDSQPKMFSILMDLTLRSKAGLAMDIQAVGEFIVDAADVEQDDLKKQFVNVNAPAIMFPYVRSFISTFTSNLGHFIKPIILPSQFFAGELKEHKESSIENESTPKALL